MIPFQKRENLHFYNLVLQQRDHDGADRLILFSLRDGKGNIKLQFFDSLAILFLMFKIGDTVALECLIMVVFAKNMNLWRQDEGYIHTQSII
jgi:hypothetical protein